jgi:hypothetical protein
MGKKRRRRRGEDCVRFIQLLPIKRPSVLGRKPHLLISITSLFTGNPNGWNGQQIPSISFIFILTFF